MTVVVTCGPAWEPIDGMRRLTNASTGELGRFLAEALVGGGHRVLVLRGSASVAPVPAGVAGLTAFDTNDDLVARLTELAVREPVHAVLHAAALCDYRVARVTDAASHARSDAKIPTSAGALSLHLEPATKVLPRLKEWFPAAWICGWKYELGGTREDALAAARRQLNAVGSAACVLNGRAWGDGFALCEARGEVAALPDRSALARALLQRLARLDSASRG